MTATATRSTKRRRAPAACDSENDKRDADASDAATADVATVTPSIELDVVAAAVDHNNPAHNGSGEQRN